MTKGAATIRIREYAEQAILEVGNIPNQILYRYHDHSGRWCYVSRNGNKVFHGNLKVMAHYAAADLNLGSGSCTIEDVVDATEMSFRINGGDTTILMTI